MRPASSDTLFKLIRIALGTEYDYSLPNDVVWSVLIEVSFQHGVAPLCVDAYQKIYDVFPDWVSDLDSPERESVKYDWFAESLNCELEYETKLMRISTLARLLDQHDLRFLLLKGLGLSQFYPIPSHRTSSDIDIFAFGQGKAVDELVGEQFGIKVEQDGDRHSVLRFDDVTVENHSCFANCYVHPSTKPLNDYLVDKANSSDSDELEDTGALLPSPMFNALFIPYHCAGHFVHGECTLRQLCDWACFVMKCGKDIDWNQVKKIASASGFFCFFCCLNGIVQDYLGVPRSSLPDWPRNKVLEERIMDDILAPSEERTTLLSKIVGFYSSGWKYKLVYNDNIIIASFRQARSYLRLRNKHAVSIWDM